ncbi:MULTISPECIES: ion transporter [Odoribacteraceae]|uniref:ion transporter n=1 Tax=Odoribacteraceae TaxID=1853231 RepID=UPI000E48F981|nr:MULTISPECIES: ion transporter [Odoribacteraceae]MCQ4874229.1 ion channel [Butyricimonas paravirosa]RHR74826.1 two pore domain potassium channel family protein [Odoribacter sp. AF15-53]
MKKSKALEKFLNALVLLGSMAIIVIASIELLEGNNALSETFILKFHLWICGLFLADFFVRWYTDGWTGRFFRHNIFFLLVSIPYLNIVYSLSTTISHSTWLILRLIPLARGIYGVSLIVGWMTRSRITNLFATYLTILFTTIYFCSIVFYYMEHDVNPPVKTYWDAFDWALMNVTTVGSNIFGVTKIGQVLAVILASAGMIFFPIFTAYVTTKFQSKRKGVQDQTN